MPCSPQMTKCKTSCLHRALVGDYRIARHNAEQQADEVSIGYATEYAEYVEDHPLITFKDWLIGHNVDVNEVPPTWGYIEATGGELGDDA